MRRGAVTVGILALAAAGVALAVRARPAAAPACPLAVPAASPEPPRAPRLVLPPDPPEPPGRRAVGCGGRIDEDGEEILVKCGRG